MTRRSSGSVRSVSGPSSFIAWTRDKLETYYTPTTIKGLRSVIDGEGLVLSQFVSSPRKMASADPEERAEAVAHMKRLVDVGLKPARRSSTPS